MSDRVAVMREGRVLQLGTPDEIYSQPAHVEVARFVGAPRINLLQAEIRGTGVWVQGWQIGRVAQGQEVATCLVGFRPQVGLRDKSEGLALHGRISGVEYTGADMIVTVKLAQTQEQVTICLPAQQAGLRVGEPLEISVPLAQLHVFGADGQRLAFQPRTAQLDAAA